MSLNRFGGLITGTFNPLTDQKTATVEYLVVAGGGGGVGSYPGGNGGGGAGGLLTSTGFPIAIGTTYTITIGAGGVGGASFYATGSDGQNTVFGSITTIGGGGAGSQQPGYGGRPGGSGGGGAYDRNFNITVNAGVGDPNAIAEAVTQVIQDAVDRGTLRGGGY